MVLYHRRPDHSSPAIGADGTIYVGSWDTKLYAINPNGTLKWSYTTGERIDSSPAIGADGTIYVGSWDQNLYAINPNGTLKWSYDTGIAVLKKSSPAIGADGTIYVGSGNISSLAINPNGTLKWSYDTGNYVIILPLSSELTGPFMWGHPSISVQQHTLISMPSIPTVPSSGPIPQERELPLLPPSELMGPSMWD